MTFRLLLAAYFGLAGVLPAGDRPWLAAPLCLVVTLATGALWTRALAGTAAETAIPAVRGGLAAVAGLVTWPLIALVLHAAGQPVRPAPLVIGGTVLVTLLGAAAALRDRWRARRRAAGAGLPAQRRHDPAAPPAEGTPGHEVTPSPPHRHLRTAAAVTIPVILAVGVSAVTVRGYLKASRPAEPGYLSIALNGWAAAIDSPVTVPARGLVVPVRITSAGLGVITRPLRLRVGGRVVASRPMTVKADSVRSLTVYVPALPGDGCLHPINISVGDTSTGFYARGDGGSGPALRAPTGASRTGPGAGSRGVAGEPDPGGDRAPATSRGAAAANRTAAC